MHSIHRPHEFTPVSMPHTPKSISHLLNETDTDSYPEKESSNFLPTPVSPFQDNCRVAEPPLMHTPIKAEAPQTMQPSYSERSPTASPTAHAQAMQFSFSVSRPTPSQNATPSPAADAKRFPCPQCNQRFSRPHNLKSHLATHSDERPYKCDSCPAKFRRQHDLKRHQKMHSGEKPYSCNVCHRSFSRLDALSRHRRAEGGNACQPRSSPSRSHSPPSHTTTMSCPPPAPTTRPVIPPLNLDAIVKPSQEPSVILPFPSMYKPASNDALYDAYASLSEKYKRMEQLLSAQHSQCASDLDAMEKKVHQLEVENRLLRSIIVDTRNACR